MWQGLSIATCWMASQHLETWLILQKCKTGHFDDYEYKRQKIFQVTFQRMTIPNHYIWLYNSKKIMYMVKWVKSFNLSYYKFERGYNFFLASGILKYAFRFRDWSYKSLQILCLLCQICCPGWPWCWHVLWSSTNILTTSRSVNWAWKAVSINPTPS